MDKMLRSKKWILLFLLPALLIFTATVFVPIIWSMVYSLYSWNGVSAMRFVGLENFADMFSDKNFVQSVVNNLIFVAINVVGQLFGKIKLPLMSEVFVVALVMVVNGCLKAFDIIFISTSGGPGYSSELVATYMYKVAFTSAKYGYGSAIALFLVVESMIAVMLIRKIANRVQRNSL